jgi:hypothetical protein
MERRYENLAAWGLGSLGVLLGGVGVLLFSDRGRRILRSAGEKIWHAPDQFELWNESAQQELDRIKETLNHLAQALQEAQS